MNRVRLFMRNNFRACLYESSLTAVPSSETEEVLKTPTKSNRTYLKAVSKVPLRPTKSLSPPMVSIP